MDALILSGGGAFGAYEVGVIKALTEKRSLEAGAFTGTSVGAFNAAILTTETIARLEDIWLHEIGQAGLTAPNGVMRVRGNPLPYWSPPHPAEAVGGMLRDSVYMANLGMKRGLAALWASGSIASRAGGLLDMSELISVDPLRKTIARTVSFPGIRKAGAPQLRIIATDWELGKPVIFKNEHMSDALGGEHILASTAIPGVFPPIAIEGKMYVDGGVVMNTPLQPAIEAGAETLHVISVDPLVHHLPPTQSDNTIGSLLRTVQIAIGSAIREDMATSQWINSGITVMEKAAAGGDVSSEELREFTRVASQLEDRARSGKPFKQLTIHHYQPDVALGGVMTMLDFRDTTIAALIARGYADGANHNCEKAGCVLPSKQSLALTAR
jgi:NTE family protein